MPHVSDALRCGVVFRDAYQIDGAYMHDPLTFAAVLDPSLFEWREGAVRVVVDGIARGATIMDAGAKRWVGTNVWLDRPKVQVAVAVDAERAIALMLERMLR
jgi:inosine-uridine nucleoside N-ribohydrolase